MRTYCTAGTHLFLVPVVGVEPTRYRYHWILSPARLPIPSYRRITRVLYHILFKKSTPFSKKINFYQKVAPPKKKNIFPFPIRFSPVHIQLKNICYIEE